MAINQVLTQDEHFMAQAIDCAKQGLYSTRPNPCVGCVIVKDGAVVGKGFHPKAGEPHAEVFALRQAKNNTQGATAYVTLEPCSHYGRTPPCALALIQAGIKRVVIAGLDPNPKVAGQGVAMLEEAGIEVDIGILKAQAQTLNLGFLKAMITARPYVRLKIAASLDGRTAMANGQSKWITGQEARLDVQYLRARSGAIVTGSGTIIADNPALTVRLDDFLLPQPKVVVMDRRHRLKSDDEYQVLARFDTLLWRDGIDDLLSLLVRDYQCYDVLVEAGGELATAFLLAGAVDELVIYQAPCLLGKTAKPMFMAVFEQLSDRLSFELQSVTQLGVDIKLVFTPKR